MVGVTVIVGVGESVYVSVIVAEIVGEHTGVSVIVPFNVEVGVAVRVFVGVAVKVSASVFVGVTVGESWSAMSMPVIARISAKIIHIFFINQKPPELFIIYLNPNFKEFNTFELKVKFYDIIFKSPNGRLDEREAVKVMKKTILMVLISMRNENAVRVQKFLTEYGCLIKTRLGVHDTSPDKCSNYGLIIIELTGDKKEQDELANKLKTIKGVQVKLERLKVK
jgi:hypothetical protein